MTSNSRKDNKGVSPPNVGVRLSGTLSVPLSLHFVQTTPPIPYVQQSKVNSKKSNKTGIRGEYSPLHTPDKIRIIQNIQ